MDLKEFLEFMEGRIFRFFDEYAKIRDERDDLRVHVTGLQMTIQRMESERNLYPYQIDDKDKEIAALKEVVKEHETRRFEICNVCLKTIRLLPKQLILYTVRGRPVHAYSVGNDGFPAHARLIAEHDDVLEVAYYVQQDWKEKNDEG